MDVLQPVTFVACDVDRLAVAHQLPRGDDDRRPIVTLQLAAEGDDQSPPVPIDYTGEGTYAARLIARLHGAFSLVLRLGDLPTKVLAGSAVCRTERVALPGGRCGCVSGTYQLTEASPCEPCAYGTSSVDGAVGSPVTSCDVCSASHFRTSVSDPSSSCTPCPEGATCGFNATLTTMLLRDGYWRLSPLATRLLPCIAANGSAVSCVGGAPSGQCAPGMAGPLCTVCTNDTQYHDEDTGTCLECPDASTPTFVALLFIAGCVLLATALWLLVEHAPPWLECVADPMREVIDLARAGLGSKLRVGVSFFQCVTVVGSSFAVKLPPEYYDWMKVFDWLHLDWLDAVLPIDCTPAAIRTTDRLPYWRARLMCPGLCAGNPSKVPLRDS